MAKRVLLNGADGKMGRMIAGIINNDPGYGLILCGGREEGQEFGGSADIVVDFSLPKGAEEAYALAKKLNAAFLTGTTNLTESFLKQLREEKEIPVFHASNMSIGVYLFGLLLQKAAWLYAGYETALNEIHHTQKKDAPSGTAKTLAALINFPQGKITAQRISDTVGTHSAVFSSEYEEITLTHKAKNRALFADSAVLTAAWLLKQKPGFYSMADYIKSLEGNK